MVTSQSKEQVDLIGAQVFKPIEQQQNSLKQSESEIKSDSDNSVSAEIVLDSDIVESDSPNAEPLILSQTPTNSQSPEVLKSKSKKIEDSANSISSSKDEFSSCTSSSKLSSEVLESEKKVSVEITQSLQTNDRNQNLEQPTETFQNDEPSKPNNTDSKKEEFLTNPVESQTPSVKAVAPKPDTSLKPERTTTASPIPKLPKVSTGQWGSFLKRAVANVEQTLDKVIQETATSEIGTSSTPALPIVTNEPTDETILSPQPIRPSSGRLSMQERLAKAVGSRNSPSKSPISSPRSSIDQQRPSSFDLKPSVTPDISCPDTPASEISDVKDRDFKELEDIVKTLPDGDSKSKIEEQLAIFLGSYTNKLSTFVSESHSAQEKINSLESKLKFLAREEAEFAKKEKSSSSGIQRKLAEKEEQVALLLEEGQILSKNELKHMTTIKNLRARERESDRHIKDAQKRQENAEREANKLRDQLRTLQDVEKKVNEAIKARTKAENENESLKKEKQLHLVSHLSKRLIVNERFSNFTRLKSHHLKIKFSY